MNTPVAFLAVLSFGLATDPPPAVPADHAAVMAAGQKLFAESVRDILAKNCLDCHGGEKTKSGFDLTTRESLLKGGDGGAAVVPGKASESRLMKLVRRDDEPHMPPKTPLSMESADRLAKWIDLGAAYDRPLVEAKAAVKGPLTVTENDRQYWAYRPLQNVTPTAARDPAWSRNPIDRFVRSKLDAAGVSPVPDADRRTLIRRVAFDLIGLPPTADEVEAFVADSSPNAFERVVDRLLAHPGYGERWGRHWLDPARYAESHGFEHDYYRPNAYHYRDFVIKALNADMPYDQFVRWQVAGDELAPGDPLALAATGFLGAGVYPTQITNREAERVRYDAMDDMLATTGHAVLALTVGCARCHDHKYDPIPTRDYYRMLAAFTTTVRAEVEYDLGTPAEKKATADFEARLTPLADELKRYEDKELPKALTVWLETITELPKVPEGPAAKGLTALKSGTQTIDKLPKAQRDAALKWFAPQNDGWKERQAKVRVMEKGRPKNTKVLIQATTEGRKPMRHHTADGAIPDFYTKTFFLKRGDADQRDGEASPGFLQVLSRKSDETWAAKKPDTATTSFRRVGLANWLTDAECGAGALAARVIVNRLWHHHFGRGIVATLNDFGFQGDPATHPELLEWLANDLVKNGWTLKRIHKQIVMSRTYQLSGTASPAGLRLDPDNKLWAHRPRRRLEAEAIRDNWLAVSGLLDPTMYGPGLAEDGMARRSIYFRVRRSQMPPMLQVFDWPDSLTSAAARPTTTVAPQALLFLNNPHVRKAATAFAETLKAEKSAPMQVDRAYRMAFGRPPSRDESAAGVEFLTKRSLEEYALVLFGLNEFIYVD